MARGCPGGVQNPPGPPPRCRLQNLRPNCGVTRAGRQCLPTQGDLPGKALLAFPSSTLPVGLLPALGLQAGPSPVPGDHPEGSQANLGDPGHRLNLGPGQRCEARTPVWAGGAGAASAAHLSNPQESLFQGCSRSSRQPPDRPARGARSYLPGAKGTWAGQVPPPPALPISSRRWGSSFWALAPGATSTMTSHLRGGGLA